MTKFLVSLGLTRDSLALLAGKIISLCSLIVFGGLLDPHVGLIDPTAIGLSAKAVHIIQAVSILVLYLSGQLSTSSLPGKADPNKVSDATRLGAGAAILLAVGLATASCAGNKPPVANPAPITSPSVATTLVTSLSVLQTAAIALAPVDGIPPADTTIIVNAVSDAVKVIEAGQQGWVSAVDAGLSLVPSQLSPATAATLDPYFAAIQAAISALYGSGVS